MIPFKKIVFPVDYSAPCAAIVPYVRDMQQHFSCELTLVHAYGAEALAYSVLPITDPALPQQVSEFQDKQLREFAEKHFAGVCAETIPVKVIRTQKASVLKSLSFIVHRNSSMIA